MKSRLITLLLVLLLAANQFVDGQTSLQFNEDGLKNALELSRAENKPVFFFCFASWCPHCKKMRETLFTDASVIAYYSQHFICVQQDMEKGEGIELHKTFQIKSYPTFIFIDSNGNTLYRLTGEFKAPEFITEGENALTKRKQLPYLKQQFEQDVSNADNCLEYLRTLKKGGIDYTDVVNKYFATQTDRQLLSEKNWLIIANGTTDINSREFQYVLSHRREFSKIASPERVERKIYYLVKELVTPLVETNDTINYFAIRKSASGIGQFNVDSLLFMYDITLFQVNANWQAYTNETLNSAEKFVWSNPSELTDIATVYLNHISDNAALNQALNWVKHAITLNEEYDSYILGAKLCRKINDKLQALHMAQQAKDLAVKDGWDYTDAENLLNELK
jgi:thioredoxin-related protein